MWGKFFSGVFRGMINPILFGVIYGIFFYYVFNKRPDETAKALWAFSVVISSLFMLPPSWHWISPDARERRKASPPWMNPQSKFWMREMAGHFRGITEALSIVQGHMRTYSTAPTKDTVRYNYWKGVRRALDIVSEFPCKFESTAFKDGKKIPITVKNYFDYFGEDA